MKYLHLIILLTSGFRAKGQDQIFPCVIPNSEEQIVVNINESRGDDFSQETYPPELPIGGVVDSEIKLDLENPDNDPFTNLFVLDGKSLRLKAPLDRDKDDLASVMMQVVCTQLTNGRRKTIPVVVTVADVNDNAPAFIGTPYVVALEERTRVGAVVYRGIKATDNDSNRNAQIEYSIVDEGNENGGLFSIDLPHQGLVTLAKPLDFETAKVHFLRIAAVDRAFPESERFTSTATLVVNVLDSDDLPPKFLHSEYNAKVTKGEFYEDQRALEVFPEIIRAEDQDSLRSDIRYSFETGFPENYLQYFEVDAKTGVLKLKTAIPEELKIPKFEITVKGTESTLTGMSTTAKLTVYLQSPEEVNAPKLAVTARVGYIKENSKAGAAILDSDGKKISFSVVNSQENSLVNYDFEMTTGFFNIDPETGNLVVSEGQTLDRDPPNEEQLNFQVFVREKNEAEKKRVSSIPVSMSVNVLDENDNAPVLDNIPDVVLPAGNSKREIGRVSAVDLDGDKNLKFNLEFVSNNGKNKFIVNERTGTVEVVGKVNNGQHYSLTISATDSGGLSGKGIMEVRVTDQPNLRGPKFEKYSYEAQISEGAPKKSTIISAEAIDPEGGPVKYSIVDGNAEGHFEVEESTGLVRTTDQLDREKTDTYKLMIRAEDIGGKYSSAVVNIRVTDINDENPVFMDEPFSFRVDESVLDAEVGSVQAVDPDLGDNSVVIYSVPEDSAFRIDPVSGLIKTKVALDFEENQVHYVVVTAKDGSRNPRIATATATILVQDKSDEIPIFKQPIYKVEVDENSRNKVVLTVEAEDRDSDGSVTYQILQGDRQRFRIDPVSGELTVIRGLDYELSNHFSLTVGTVEGGFEGPEGFSCKVDIEVMDMNDNAPVFERNSVNKQFQVRNDAEIGARIGTVKAVDRDGTAPNNEVIYELGQGRSSERSDQYFSIDPVEGTISIKGDLTRELYDEYTLEITAKDKGEPSQSATTFAFVRVAQVVTPPPDSGIGFESSDANIEVEETLEIGQSVVVLPLEKGGSSNINGLPLECHISEVRGADGKKVREKIFASRIDEERNCEIYLEKNLDFENENEFEIKIGLKTLSAFINPDKVTSSARLRVKDVNDNIPEFEQERYLLAVPENTQAGSDIIAVKAVDSDVGEFGRITYKLSDDNDANARYYFAVDKFTGEVTNIADFEDVDRTILPFEVIIAAEDNPEAYYDNERNSATATVVVNVLRPGDGIVLTVADTTPSKLWPKKDDLAEILKEITGFEVSVDRIIPSVSKYSNGTCCQLNPEGSDVYFHVIDPETSQVLSYEDPKVFRALSGKKAADIVKYTVSGQLGVQASDIHEPYINAFAAEGGQGEGDAAGVTAASASFIMGYPAFLIAVAAIILFAAVAGIIYICFAKRRLQTQEEKSQVEKTIVVPRYEPVFLEPGLKEYETQVLQMSVTLDDQADANGNGYATQFYPEYYAGRKPSFNIDNISYITKDTTIRGNSFFSTGSDGSGLSDDARTKSFDLSINNASYAMPSSNNQSRDPQSTSSQSSPRRKRSIFDRSDSDGEHGGLKHLSASTASAFSNRPSTQQDFVASSTPRRKQSVPEYSTTVEDLPQQALKKGGSTTQL